MRIFLIVIFGSLCGFLYGESQNINEILNRYSNENNIGIIIESNEINILQYTTEENIYLYQIFLSDIYEIYVNNIIFNYSNDIRKEVKYNNGRLEIIETIITRDSDNAMIKKDIKTINYIEKLFKDLHNQYMSNKISFPISIPKMNETIPILNYLTENEYLLIEKDYDVIISRKNGNNELLKFVDYLFISMDILKIKLINTEYEWLDDFLLYQLLNSIFNRIIDNLEIDNYNVPDNYYEIICVNKAFMDNYFKRDDNRK